MNTTSTIDLTAIRKIRGRFPDTPRGKCKWVEEGVPVPTALRSMNVGDIYIFPVLHFSPATIRSCPKGSLSKERMIDGMAWATGTDDPNKATLVIRYQ